MKLVLSYLMYLWLSSQITFLTFLNSCPCQLYWRLSFWPDIIFILSPPQQVRNCDSDKHSALAASANVAPETPPYFIGVNGATPLKPIKWCECQSCAILEMVWEHSKNKKWIFFDLIHLLNLMSYCILLCRYGFQSGLLCTASFPNKSPF